MRFVKSVEKKSTQMKAVYENRLKEGVCATDASGARVETCRGVLEGVGKW
jgi:hypothetical protein